MTDTELTEKFAEFMNYKIIDCDCDGVCVEKTENVTHHEWSPLEDISDAWELVEKLEVEGFVIYLSNPMNGQVMWTIGVYKPSWIITGKKLIEENEKSAPRAICMSVLKVIENGDESHG